MCLPTFDVESLNAAMGNEEQLPKELLKIAEIAQELGLNLEAITYLVEEIVDSFDAGDPVEIFYCGESAKVPTQSTGYGNFYYWRSRGNSYFDTNTHFEEYETSPEVWEDCSESWIKIRVHKEVLVQE